MERAKQEQLWVRLARNGDREAFSHLVEAYQVPVYNLAYRMLGDAWEAEDAAQETFLRAYTRLHTYREDKPFGPWLLAIAAHHCIDRLRRRRIRWLSWEELGSQGSPPAGLGNPEEEAIRREEEAEVQALLATLTPENRALIVLRYWHGLSCREIASILGLSESAVKTRLHRARRFLARQLKGE